MAAVKITTILVVFLIQNVSINGQSTDKTASNSELPTLKNDRNIKINTETTDVTERSEHSTKELNSTDKTTPNFEVTSQRSGITIDTNLLTYASTIPGISIKIPQKWHGMCTVTTDQLYESEFTPRTPLTTFKCDVSSEFSGVWTMKELRSLLTPFNESGLAFGLEISCAPFTNISLSQPVKVPNLMKLVVSGCVVHDYLAEFDDKIIETIPDSLRFSDMKNNIIALSLMSVYKTTVNIKNVSKAFDCMHEKTIEHMGNRNTSYTFIEDASVSELSLLGHQFMLDAQRVPHTCEYNRLLSIDASQSESRSIYYMKLMTQKAVYLELRTYNLSYNYLKTLQDQQLKWSIQFPKLELFDLSHNDISKLYRFEVPLNNDVNKTTTINLQYNNISSITVEELDRFKLMPMMFIDIRNNPIDCNCSEDLKELLDYINQGKHYLISNLTNYAYIGELQCASPKDLFGRTLLSLSTDSICHTSTKTEYFFIPLVIMTIVLIIVIIILILVLKFRQEITVILFTRFNIIVPCQARDSCDSSKVYDAFVSYSSNEEEEVETLFEELEHPTADIHHTPFRFCLHHRDFVAGKTIFDNVTNSVEKSRHTIILLSKHFLNSQFCLYEFKEAFRQSVMEQRRHLVIVMMEDIPEQSLPRELKRCIKTFTYIRRDDSLFKERLVFALSIKQKTKVVQPKLSSFSNNAFNCDIPLKESEITKDSAIDILNDINNFRSPIKMTSGVQLNELNKTEPINNNENEHPKNTTIIQRHNYDINIDISDNNCQIPVERKLSNLEFDRCVSSDTGYGSERGSYCEKLSPEVTMQEASFPSPPLVSS